MKEGDNVANALDELYERRKKRAEEQQQEAPDALDELYERRRQRNALKNAGGGFGAGLGYVAGRIGTDTMGVVEGITDVLAATGDLLMLNPQKAKERFTNSYTGEWRESLDEWYNPGKGMQITGDITGGVGQALAYTGLLMIPYAGAPLMYTSIGSQGVSSAAQKTGKLGLKELGYGVTVGALEGLLESKLGAAAGAAKDLGSAVLKGTGKSVVKSAAKEAGEGAAKTIIKGAAKNFAGEFAEEAISEAVDPTLQRWFGIDKEARADIGSILYAGFVGGVSGGITSALTSGINYATAVNVGKTLKSKGLDQDLVRRAKYTLQGLDIAKGNAEAMRVEKPTGDEKETFTQWRERRSANKESKKISKITKDVGEKLQKNIDAYEQMQADPAKANSNAAAAVLGEMRGNLFVLGRAFEVDTVEAFMKDSSDAERQVFVDVINEAQAQQKTGKSYTLADFDEDKDQIRRRLAGQLMFEEAYNELARKLGVTDATESPTEAAGEAQDLWAGIAEDADLEALGATSETERALMQAARIQGVPNASVAEMLNQFRKGTALTPAEFADGWADGTQTYGRFGFDTKDADGTAFGRMETEAREAAVKYGRESAEAETRKREEAAKAKKKPAEQAGKKGEVVRGEGLNIQKLSDEQYSAYKASEVLAEVLGTDIVLETSIERNGKTVNGYYSRKTNRLHININAMRNGKNIAVYTLGHEVTHYIKEWSPAKFKVLQDFVMNHLGDKAPDLIAAKAEFLRQMPDYKDYTVAQLNDLAVEEVVADSMELVLTDGKVLEELAHTDRSIWQKVKAWISNIVSKIKKYYGELSGASKTAQVLRETMESLDEIERLFTEGAKEAGERARTAGVDVEVRSDGNIVYAVGDEETKNATELSEEDLRVLLENVQNGLFEDGTYLPLRRNTPEFYIEVVRDHSKGKMMVQNFPMAATVEHLRQNMEEVDGQSYGEERPHELSVDDIITISKKMGDPAYIVLQKNGRYAEVVSYYDSKKKKEVVVSIDIADSNSKPPKNFKHATYMNGYEGGYYNIIVTQHELDDLQSYLKNNTVVYDKKKTNGKYQVGSGRIVTVTHDTPFVEDIVPQPDDSVNSKLSISEEISSENSSDIRYSMDETAENADVSENERLKAENKKLEERVQRMRYRQFRKAVESGEMEAKAHKQELSDGATTVLESIGIGDGRNHTELTRRMSELYAKMSGEKKISYGEAFDEASKISDWLLGVQLDIRNVEASERAKEILKTLRSTKILLTFTQKGEVANLMGNSDAYRKAMFGKVTVTNNDGVPLDVQWAEWSDLYPDVFSKEVDEADMPDRLRRIYDMLTMQRDRTESVDQYIDRDELTNTIFTQVGQIGWNEIQTEEARPDLSDRDMLLAIAEQMVGSENEYKIISDYKKKYDGIRRKEKRIQELNDRQQELQSILFTSEDAKARSDASKELRAIYEETSGLLEEMAEADKKLANIEGMKVIRNLIKVERMEARETYKTQYEERQRSSAERKEITDRKRQVQRILNSLNTMLYHPTKAKHVPPLMQSLVDYALKRADPKQFGINRDNIRTMAELAADIEKVKRKVALTADEQEQLYKMETKYEALEADTLSVKRQAEALMTAFETWVEQTSDAEVVDENMLQGLRDTVKEIDEAPLHLMTLKSLEAVESLYKAIKHQVDHSNNLFATDKKLGVQEMGQEASAEVAKQKESKLFTPKPGEWTKIARVREFIWENLKPLTAFEVIGSDKLMSLFRNILNGEDVWVTDVLEGKKVLDEAKKKYGYNKWDLTARKEVTTADGSTVSLTLGERMSLYAYMFRDQAEEHLSTGGFKLAPDAKTIGKLKGVKAYEAFLNDQNAYQMRREDIAKMAEGLTQDQKDYARAVQKYLTTLGKKGNEVSLKLYGVEIFNETDYFPIKSDRDYLKAQAGKTGDPQIKNRGTFKETTPGANNPIVLEDFMQVTSEHINTMAVYHAFTLPMEDLLRVWNYKPVNFKTDENGNVLLDDTGKPMADKDKKVEYNSLKAEIAKKYGKKANDYILQLMRDLNGGARQDSATTILDKGLTAFKRSATMLSLSTIIQQPTSIFRAMAYVDAKYFKGAKFYDYETVKKYAPVAAIKQIGRHDTGTGASTVEYLNSKEYDNKKEKLEKLKAAVKPKLQGGDPQARADYFGFLTEKADEVAWRYMFGACVNEQAAKLKKPASSEEVLQAAGERFADVVRRTQVYDSTLTRSEIMRSKSSAAKLVTAFGAEPATVVSMLVDGIVKAERGDKSFFRKTAGAVAISIIINAMASSLIYAMRDDDEDENFLEKYVQALTGEIIEGFNLFEYLPYARDVMSLFKGYDVERSDMTLIGNLFDQVEMITSSKRSFLDKLFGVSGAVSAFFGVPITNVYRDAKGAIKTALSLGDMEPVTGSGTGLAIVEGVKSQNSLWFKIFGAQEGNAYELYKAALRGDTAHYDRVAARYETEKDAEMALRKELRENDKRIAEAAQAKIDGELEVFESVVEQIEGEGHFDRNLIIRAVNNEVLAIKDAEKQAKVPKDETADTEEDEDEIEVEALYTASDLTDAIDRGDNDDFADVYEYLLSFKMEQGKTEAQAKASIKSSVTSKYKKLYLEAWAKNNTVEMRRLLELLIKTGLYGNHNDTAKTVEKWVRDANK